MNFIYATIICNDAYLPGLKGLYRSLKSTGTKYPFYAFCGPDVSQSVENSILKLGRDINIIRYKRDYILPENLIKNNSDSSNSRWNYTFDKLLIFDFTEYEHERIDKIIFLDSDMMVLQNLDHLFNKKHMSAVNAGVSYPGNQDWLGLNSGILVIEPQKNLLQHLLETIPKILEERSVFGDQDVLSFYYSDWTSKSELNLGEKYNVFAGYLPYYRNVLGYNFNTDINDPKSIAVLHYIGENKPWDFNPRTFHGVVEYFIYFICDIFHIRKMRTINITYKVLCGK